MARRRRFLTFIAPVAVVLATVGSVYAAYQTAHSGIERVPLPDVRDAKGKACVRSNAIMRRDHMVFLLRQRYITVHYGIHATRYSLIGCVNCHANPVTHSVLGKNGFCESCHVYNAVSISCFSCHSPYSSGPAGRAAAAAAALRSAEFIRPAPGVKSFGNMVAQTSTRMTRITEQGTAP
ncbi:MAG: hypothetical protein ACYCXG_08725 [Acidiferrobacter sp.]